MSHKKFMLLIGFATVVAWAGLGTVLLNIDPTQSGISGILLFYLTLFTSLVGTLTLLGVLFRIHIAKRKEIILREVRIAFRHAVLLSATAVVALALSSKGSFRWWILPLLLVTVGGVEYVFLNRDSSGRL
ncbi:MAG: hypothetical protein NUV81_01670 [bacterium]|nr:hypothetical protein [bacterium]